MRIFSQFLMFVLITLLSFVTLSFPNAEANLVAITETLGPNLTVTILGIIFIGIPAIGYYVLDEMCAEAGLGKLKTLFIGLGLVASL